ncbi:MAG: GH36 C-terminal domain-containing protein [Mediterraneibacter faecis]
MVTNEDRTLAIVGYYRVLNGVNQPYSRVRLQGLNRIWFMKMYGTIQKITEMN